MGSGLAHDRTESRDGKKSIGYFCQFPTGAKEEYYDGSLAFLQKSKRLMQREILCTNAEGFRANPRERDHKPRMGLVSRTDATQKSAAQMPGYTCSNSARFSRFPEPNGKTRASK